MHSSTSDPFMRTIILVYSDVQLLGLSLTGPSYFVPAVEVQPPEDDIRYFDARHLVVRQRADAEVS